MSEETSEDMTIYRAFLTARTCAEFLLSAHHMPKDQAPYYVEYAIRESARMANFLGYDLVKREPAKQSEAA